MTLEEKVENLEKLAEARDDHLLRAIDLLEKMTMRVVKLELAMKQIGASVDWQREKLERFKKAVSDLKINPEFDDIQIYKYNTASSRIVDMSEINLDRSEVPVTTSDGAVVGKATDIAQRDGDVYATLTLKDLKYQNLKPSMIGLSNNEQRGHKTILHNFSLRNVLLTENAENETIAKQVSLQEHTKAR